MRVYPLPQETMSEKGATHCVELGFADFTAAGNTQTIKLFTTSANVRGAELTHMELAEAFVSSDASLISTAVTVGDAGSNNRQLTSTELNAAGTVISLKGGALANNAPRVPTADEDVNAYFTATGAKVLTTHTAGLVRFYFRVLHAIPQVSGGAL